MITIEDINLIVRSALFMVIKMSFPVLMTSMIIGLIISIFQTVTSIQEQTLIFIPKILAVFLCIVLLSPWIGQRMLVMTREILGQLERFIN